MGSGDVIVRLFEELLGEQLSAVTFVQDYLQLWFDGSGISVINPLTVMAGESAITSWMPGFRDLLCGQIGKIVSGIWHCREARRGIGLAPGAGHDAVELFAELDVKH